MYRNLNVHELGVSGRQSELIELALTYGFRGVSININDLAKRARNYDVAHACRFHKSANLRIGSFKLPVDWYGTDDLFKASLAKLDEYLDIARELGAKRCVTHVQPAADDLPYHENFERHRDRLGEVAEKLAADEIRLGVGFLAAKEYRQDKQFQFIFQADDVLALIKSVPAKNVGLWFDSWDWRVGGGSLDQLRELPDEDIVAVHLSDVPGEVDLNEILDKQRLLPGDGGVVDAPAIVKMLREMDYSGPVSCSPHPEVLAGNTRDQIIQVVGRIMEQLWTAAGLLRPAVPVEIAMGASAEVEEEGEDDGDAAESNGAPDGD